MKNRPILVRIVCALVLLAGALWFFQAQPVSLGKQLPEKTWVNVELEKMVPMGSEDLKYDQLPTEDILYQLQILHVSRAKEAQLPKDEHFRITLHKADGWPAVLYVTSTGRVHLCTDMQFGEWMYFEGAEALYVYLDNLSQMLPLAQ